MLHSTSADNAHVFIPLIMLPPFNLVSKTLRTLLRYLAFTFPSFPFIESYQHVVYPDIYNLLLQLILSSLFHQAMGFHQAL